MNSRGRLPAGPLPAGSLPLACWLPEKTPWKRGNDGPLIGAAGMGVPEPMYRTVSDADQPRLCIRTARKELVASGKRVLPHLELPCLHVNRHDLAPVTFLHLRPHPLLVDRLTTPGELLFAVTRLSFPHGVLLMERLSIPA